MLRPLRRQITAILTLFTGLLLGAVMGFSLWSQAEQAKTGFDLAFCAAAEDVIDFLETLPPGEAQQSVYYEAAPRMVEISGGAGPLPVARAVDDAERETLMTRAVEASLNAGLTEWVMHNYDYAYPPATPGGLVSKANAPGLGAEVLLTVESDGGEKYRAASFFYDIYYLQDPQTGQTLSPQDSINATDAESYTMQYEVYHVTLLETMAGLKAELLRLYVFYAAAFLAMAALLLVVCWFVAGLVLRPSVRSLRQQKEFVAAASHELKTPLAVISASLSAAEGETDPAAARRFRAAALEETRRMSRLVNDLLTLARSDAGEWNLRCEAVDPDTLLLGLYEEFGPVARGKGVRLALELPDTSLPPLWADQDRLRQILVVLLDNALHYAPEGSVVTLAAALCARGRQVAIDVADQGPGVPEAERDRVFLRFYQAQQSRSDEKHFGLGLSVAKELAQLHGGGLVCLETPGGGATFRLTLPVQE